MACIGPRIDSELTRRRADRGNADFCVAPRTVSRARGHGSGPSVPCRPFSEPSSRTGAASELARRRADRGTTDFLSCRGRRRGSAATGAGRRRPAGRSRSKSHKRGLGPKTPPLPNYSNLPSKNAKKKPPTDPCSSRVRDQREVLDGDNKPLDFSGSCIFLMTSVKI